MLEKFKSFIPEFNQEAFEKAQSGLVLNGIISVGGLGILAGIKALGMVKPVVQEVDLKELANMVAGHLTEV